jgi:hypothetical protein
MNTSGEKLRSGRRACVNRRASEIAAEIIDKLQYGFFQNALNGFLAKHPNYEKYSDSIMQEGKLVVIACAITASCQTPGDLEMAKDIVKCMEISETHPHLFRPKKRKGKRSASVPDGMSRIIDYVAVFRYVSVKSRRFNPSGVCHSHTSLKSVGFLAVKNMIRGGHALKDELGSTTHLLHELILPVLTAAFEQFSAPLERQQLHPSDANLSSRCASINLYPDMSDTPSQSTKGKST